MVKEVVRSAAAQVAGIDPGDELVAIGGKRVDAGSLDACLLGTSPGDVVEVVVARDGRLLTRPVTLDEPLPEKAKIVARQEATQTERALFATWLEAEHPAWSSKARRL
jgi:predicted metalloprotease with PDZ domain